MTLLIACLVIAGLDMSPAWYIVAVLVWVVHFCVQCAMAHVAGENAGKKLWKSIPGIRGTVKND